MSTRWTGTDEEVQALDAFIKLTRAANAVFERAHRHLADEYLSTSQFAVLEALHHLGPLRSCDLAKKILIPKSASNLTLVLDNLEKRDLIERRRDANDRRSVQVSLTPSGAELIHEVLPRHVQGIVREFSTLSAEERDELARLCRRVGASPNGTKE